MKKLNLGCGLDIKEGYDNLDIEKNKGVNMIWDLNKVPYPIEDNYYDEIYVKQVLEHLDNVVSIVNELHRILKPKGKLIIEVPYQTCINSLGSIVHKRVFTLCSFDVFSKQNSNTETKFPNGNKSNKIEFKNIKKKLVWAKGIHFERFICEPLFNKFPLLYEHTILRYLFPAFVVQVELEK